MLGAPLSLAAPGYPRVGAGTPLAPSSTLRCRVLQGNMTVVVTYGGDPVPKSPFSVNVAPALQLSKVKVQGLSTSESGRRCGAEGGAPWGGGHHGARGLHGVGAPGWCIWDHQAQEALWGGCGTPTVWGALWGGCTRAQDPHGYGVPHGVGVPQQSVGSPWLWDSP